MNELQFSFEDHEIRTVIKDEETWFALVDVCNILGIKNSRDVYDRLDEDERDGVDFTDTIGRNQTMQAVNEPGLYHVILTSNSEKVKPFRRWITHDVIPAIRKQGFYSMLTEDKLLEVLQERTNKDINYLSFIDKPKMKKAALMKQRAERDELTARLWDERFKEGRFTEGSAFQDELRRTWLGDMTMYHKYRDRYKVDVNRYDKGKEVEFRSFLTKNEEEI